nr:carboxypeptidase regulatory-like domain-containing protein [Anaerolineae bacterium]
IRSLATACVGVFLLSAAVQGWFFGRTNILLRLVVGAAALLMIEGGVVTDLSTGRPGAGLEVSLNGQIVRTDTDGSYSITGLAAGTYTTVLELKGQGTLAQEPLLIYVDGRTPATADLGFYSQTPPTSTPSPTATATVTPTPAVVVPVSPTAAPVRLPPSGADLRYRPWLISGLGLLLVGVGVVMRRHKVPKLKKND